MDHIPSHGDADKHDAFRRPASLFTPEELEDFRRFYEEDFLEAISLGEAEILARNFLEPYRVVLTKQPESEPGAPEPRQG